MNNDVHAPAQCARAIRGFPRGVELFQEGERLAEVFQIVGGTVKLVCTGEDGQESISKLGFVNDWLGIAPVIAEQPAQVSAITCEASRIRIIGADTFRDMLKSDLDFSTKINTVLSQDLCRQSEWLRRLTTSRSGERLRRVLRDLVSALGCNDRSGAIRVKLPIQNRELAHLVAITPEHLSRLLRELDDDGVVRRDKGWMIVPDLERLCPDSRRHKRESSPIDRGLTNINNYVDINQRQSDTGWVSIRS